MPKNKRPLLSKKDRELIKHFVRIYGYSKADVMRIKTRESIVRILPRSFYKPILWGGEDFRNIQKQVVKLLDQ